jgi:hypothetical protein
VNELTPGWKPVGVTEEGRRILLNDLNPWEHTWHKVSVAPITVAHPSYSMQRHQVRVYELHNTERTVRFAAGELSANVWGFYVPE